MQRLWIILLISLLSYTSLVEAFEIHVSMTKKDSIEQTSSSSKSVDCECPSEKDCKDHKSEKNCGHCSHVHVCSIIYIDSSIGLKIIPLAQLSTEYYVEQIHNLKNFSSLPYRPPIS